MNFIVTIDHRREFYKSYENWCEGHNFPVIGLENIGEFIVCYNDGVAIYSCILWNTDSRMCLTGFPVSNPNVPIKLKKGGLEFLYKEMSIKLKDKGYDLVWTTSATDTVINKLKNEGYKEADEFVHQYVKKL